MLDLYAARGVHAMLVTPGEGRPEFEQQRQLLNSWLVGKHSVVDCDSLVRKVKDDAWADMEHFTDEGSWTLGFLLADVIAKRFDQWQHKKIFKDKRHRSVSAVKSVQDNVRHHKRKHDWWRNTRVEWKRRCV